MLSFLSRIARSLRSTQQRRPVGRRAASLGLESLQERWTPAISITGQGTDDVVITDSNTGKTDNSIVIIDDLETLTTYIKINGGPEQQLGQDGDLLHHLDVLMGAGNDKVSFIIRGDTFNYDNNIWRNIDLGAGNDSLSVDLGQGHSMITLGVYYEVIGDTAGNDSYTAKGEVVDGCFWFESHDASGNDAYNFNLLADSSEVNIWIEDALGNDKYSLALDGLNDGATNPVWAVISDDVGADAYSLKLQAENVSQIGIEVHDEGAGSDTYKLAIDESRDSNITAALFDATPAGSTNKVTFTQGQLVSVNEVVNLDFPGVGKNKIFIGGDADFFAASSAQISFSGGSGDDSLLVNDNTLASNSVYIFNAFTFDGDDKVAMKLDGSPKSKLPSLTAGPMVFAHIELGAGDDSFSAELNGKTWREETIGPSFTSFQLTVLGEAGDDKLSFKSVNSSAVRVLGEKMRFALEMNGGDGDDQIDLNIGNLAASGDQTEILFTLIGGLGADKLSLAGKLTTPSPDVTIGGEVTLGADLDKDSFKSTFKAADSVPLPLVVDFGFNLLEYDPARDKIALDGSPRAPSWV